MSLVDLIISCSFIVLCCILAQTARKILDRVSSIHGLAKELFLEAIAAAELCSTCFELIIGEDNSELGGLENFYLWIINKGGNLKFLSFNGCHLSKNYIL